VNIAFYPTKGISGQANMEIHRYKRCLAHNPECCSINTTDADLVKVILWENAKV